jgi:hypothetical protein
MTIAGWNDQPTVDRSARTATERYLSAVVGNRFARFSSTSSYVG